MSFIKIRSICFEKFPFEKCSTTVPHQITHAKPLPQLYGLTRNSLSTTVVDRAINWNSNSLLYQINFKRISDENWQAVVCKPFALFGRYGTWPQPCYLVHLSPWGQEWDTLACTHAVRSVLGAVLFSAYCRLPYSTVCMCARDTYATPTYSVRVRRRKVALHCTECTTEQR